MKGDRTDIEVVRWCKDCNVKMGQEIVGTLKSRGWWLGCDRFREVIGLGVGFRCWHPAGTIMVRNHNEVEG